MHTLTIQEIINNISLSSIVYLFYPETAGRSLEDMDRFFHESPPIFVFRDKDIIRSGCPQKFIDIEEADYRRNSVVSTKPEEHGTGVVEVEKI